MKKDSYEALEKLVKLFDKHCYLCENKPVGTGKKATAKKEKYCFSCRVHKRMETQRKKIK